jgi:hypothetical protein
MPYTAAQPGFGKALRAAGWEEIVPFVEFRRGLQKIVFDTSSWMELSSARNSHIADLRVPEQGGEQEALILIEQAFSEGEAAAG